MSVYYLSLYEGFGLPPLEATRCGIPTLMYENSMLIELFGSAYEYGGKKKELNTLIALLDKTKTIPLSKFIWLASVKEIHNLSQQN